jgi:nitrite reductase/ring-hydroxylating ferredoxin subunit
MPHQIIAEVDVGALDEEGDSLVFEYVDEFGREAEGFVMLWGGELVAYRNRCAHWAVPLDIGDGEFLADDGIEIECRRHGARFDPGDGACTFGPCRGDSLEKFRIERQGDTATIRRGGGLTLEF